MSDDLCPTTGCKSDAVADVVSPVESLVSKWGYEPIMPRNDVVWEELSTTTHVLVGIYLFSVGNGNNKLFQRTSISPKASCFK